VYVNIITTFAPSTANRMLRHAGLWRCCYPDVDEDRSDWREASATAVR